MEALLVIKNKVEGSLDGIMAKFTQVNGQMEKNTARDYGPLLQEIATWDNGGEGLLKDKVFTLIIMDKNMKALLKIFLSMDTANSVYRMEIPMKDNIVKVNLMVMDFIYGKMEQAIKEPLLEESDKDWEL